jgi:hypothetical protein
MMKSEGIHLAGIFFSVIGLWLASAGFIGEKRLLNLETWLRERVSLTEENSTFPKFLERLFDNSIIMMIFIAIPAAPAAISMVLGAIVLLLIIPLILIFPSLYSFIEPLVKFYNQDAIGVWSWGDIMFGYPLFLALVWTPLVMLLFGFFFYLQKFLIAMFIFPYKIIDKLVLNLNLQSTLVVIGLIFGTVGVILLS